MKVAFGQLGKRQCRSRRQSSRRWVSLGSLLARPSYMVWPTSSSTADDERGVTGQAPQRLGADQPAPFELGAQRASPRRGGSEGGCGRRRRRASETPGPFARLPGGPPAGLGGNDDLDEGVGQALVPADLAVGGIGPGSGLEAGAHGDVGLFGQLGADGAQRVVAAQRAGVVRRVGLGLCGPMARTGELGQLADRGPFGRLGPLGVALGARTLGDRAHLVEAERSPRTAQRPGAGRSKSRSPTVA